MKQQPLGIFDSGLGGLTVQSAIAHKLPDEETIYLGDTARVPYGTKSSETVTGYSLEIADFLIGLEIKLLVVACNTASAYAVECLRDKLTIPVVGVIEPGARMAVEATRNMRIGVIGTEGTVRSCAYEKAILEVNPDVEVFMKPCPLFVPLAEEGFIGTDNRIAELTASYYLSELIDNDIDTLVLGCTHYPLLKAVISKVVGSSVTLIDSAEATAREVGSILRTAGLSREALLNKPPSHRFFVTDSPERFVSVGKNFLGEKLTSAELVTLTK